MTRRGLAGLVGVLLCCSVLWSCRSENTPQTLVVGIATFPGFGPGFVAKEKGFFGNLQVEFAMLDDFVARQSAFTAGKTSATISTLDSFAFEAGHGVKGRVVMILDESFGADAIIVSEKIRSVSDMKGKKIAFTRGSPSHFFLIQVLKKHGLTSKDIVQIQVDDPGRAGEAFLSGSVDGAVTWEPNISQILKMGKGRVLESTKTFPGFIIDTMVVSPEAYSKRKADVQTFVAGWLKAVEYIKQNQQEAYAVMARNLKIPESEFPDMAAGLKFADALRNKELLTSPGNNTATRVFDEASAIWREEGVITAAQPGSTMITSEFIPQ